MRVKAVGGYGVGLDGPRGVASDEVVEGAGGFAFLGVGDLVGDEAFVGRPFNLSQDAGHAWVFGVVELSEHRWIEEFRVFWFMDDDVVFGDAVFAHRDNLGFEGLVDAEAFVLLFTEKEGLVFFEEKEVVVAILAAVNGVPSLVVEDDAILQNFDEAEAGMFVRCFEGRDHVLDVVVKGASDKTGFGA